MDSLCQYEMKAWLVLAGLSILMFSKMCFADTDSDEEPEWKSAISTWYGPPEGDGSTGGACGYRDLVERAPFKTRATAVSGELWNDGMGCGACYKIKCTDESICTGDTVTVIVTDECPGCSSTGVLFDMSGSTFGRLAVEGQADALRNKGRLPVFYTRTECSYGGAPMTFQVNEGSSEYFFSILIIYKEDDGDVGGVQLQQQGSETWMGMTHLWGANWSLTGAGPIKGPFSLKVTSMTSKITTYEMNVIPRDWKPNTVYKSLINYSFLT